MSKTHEERLFATVKLIRDWVEASFTPAGESRFLRTGRLKARFDVDLGNEMCEQLQAYIKASFVLSRLHLKFTEREEPGKKAPRPCVEVTLDAEARALYAEKNPAAVSKKRGSANALQDEAKRSAIEDVVSAAEPESSCAPATTSQTPDTKSRTSAETHKRPSSTSCAADRGSTGGACDGRPFMVDNSALQSKAVGIQWRCSPKLEDIDEKAPPIKWGEQISGVSRGAWLEVNGRFLPSRIRGQKVLRPLPKVESPEKRARVSMTELAGGASLPESPWEAVLPQTVASGSAGLLEAKNDLDQLQEHRSKGGLAAIKAEQVAVAWLKGLGAREVSVAELKETKIGQTINGWRKHPEPYIAGLASSLLIKWKASWREANSSTKTRSKVTN